MTALLMLYYNEQLYKMGYISADIYEKLKTQISLTEQ